MSKKRWLLKGFQTASLAWLIAAIAGCPAEPRTCWERCSDLPVVELLECLRQFC